MNRQATFTISCTSGSRQAAHSWVPLPACYRPGTCIARIAPGPISSRRRQPESSDSRLVSYGVVGSRAAAIRAGSGRFVGQVGHSLRAFWNDGQAGRRSELLE
jgi:hypothetical protein